MNYNVINLKHLPRTDMPADVFTKALNFIRHNKCVKGPEVAQIETGS